MEVMSSKLDLQKTRKQNVRKTLDKIHEHASSMVLLTNQWKELEKKFDTVENSLDERSTELKSMEESIRERLNDLEEKEKLVDLAQERLKDQFLEVGALQQSVNGRFKAVERRERELDRKEAKFRSVQKMEMEEREKEIEQLQKKWGDFDLVRVSLVKQLEEMEENGKRFTSIEKSIDEKFGELKLKEEDLSLREKDLRHCYKELEAKEKECFEIQSKLREVEEFHKRTEMKDKVLRERFKEVEMKDKKLEERSKELNLKEKRYANEIQMDGKSLQIYLNECYKNNDFLREEVALVLRVSLDPAKLVLEAMQGFYSPHLKKGDIEFEGNAVRSSCILLLEQLMNLTPEIKCQVKKEATKLAFQWITKMKQDRKKYMEVLGFMLLLASYDLASSFDADELCDYMRNVTGYRQAPKLLGHLGLADKLTGFIKSLIQKDQPMEAVRLIYAFELEEEISPMSVLTEFMDQSEVIIRSARPTSLPYMTEKHDLNNDTIAQSGFKRIGKDVSAETASNDLVCSAAACSSMQMPCQQPRYSSRATCMTPSHVKMEKSSSEDLYLKNKVALSPYSEPCHERYHVNTDAEGLRSVLSNQNNSNLTHVKITDTLHSVSDPAKLVLDVLKGFSSSSLVQNEEFMLAVSENSCLLLLEHLRHVSCQVTPEVKREAAVFAIQWRSKFAEQKSVNEEVICFLQFIAAYSLASSFTASELLCLLDSSNWRRMAPDLCNALGLADEIPCFIQNLIGKGYNLDAIKYIFSLDMVNIFRPIPLLEAYLQSTKNREINMEIEVIDKEIADLGAINICLSNYDLDPRFSPTLLVDRILQLKELRREILQQEHDDLMEASTSPADAESQPKQWFGNRKRRRRNYPADVDSFSHPRWIPNRDNHRVRCHDQGHRPPGSSFSDERHWSCYDRRYGPPNYPYDSYESSYRAEYGACYSWNTYSRPGYCNEPVVPYGHYNFPWIP